MLKSNISTGSNANVFYIDYDNFNMYQDKNNKNDVRFWNDIPKTEQSNFKINKDLSQEQYEHWCDLFSNFMIKDYPTLKRTDTYITKNKKVLLENDLFEIIIEDNRWGLAVELLSKKDSKQSIIQKQEFPNLLLTVLNNMTSISNTVYSRTGSYNAEPVSNMNQNDIDRITKGSQIQIDKTVNAVDKI